MKLNLLAVLGVTAFLSVSCITKNNSTQPSPPSTQIISGTAQVEISPEQPLTQSSTLSGTFVGAEHPTQGTARITTDNGKTYLEFGEDFKTDNGPDLVVILHRASDIKSVSTPPAYSLREQDYVVLGPLEQVSGTQRYAIPETLQLTDYNSAAIWCRQFNATFGYVSFK